MKRSSAGAQDASFSSLLASHKNAKRRRKRRKVAAQNGEVINDGPKVIAMNKPSAEELAEAVTILENALKIAKRVLGPEHPQTCCICAELVLAREHACALAMASSGASGRFRQRHAGRRPPPQRAHGWPWRASMPALSRARGRLWATCLTQPA